MASANLLLSALKALAGGELTSLLQTHLVFHEANQIDRLESQITQVLARPQGRDLSVSARVASFGTPAFSWTAERVLGHLFRYGRGKCVSQSVNFIPSSLNSHHFKTEPAPLLWR